ncbi:TPR domain-containing protein [Colletotrichum navitas]|uniref:TPR domain-containing protein n=1 Tax=Colletotrichum navitas TaxID=681940 RepID=A0AAD8V1K6_9PEZI|nr:TPR domain-containing protein [Colletotrichum navitas]KAK1585441.1 TPR domain-containing protein [Colletotrichum navitas]
MGLEQDSISDTGRGAEVSIGTHPTLNNVDFGLQIGFEEILADVDPDISLDYLKKADAHAGKPPPTRVPRETLVSTHNRYVKQQQASEEQNAPRIVKKVVLALSYPPSVKPVAELSPMHLDDLLVENHHEDKYLILRTICPPHKGAGTITIVEDDHGNTDKLALYNQGSSTILQAVPEGSVILLKEPYYKFNGDDDFMLCVDHPSDVILLRHGPDDTLIPGNFRQAPGSQVASEWRDAGDVAFISKNLPLAVANYTRALELAAMDDEVFRADLLLKRAGIELATKLLDSAIADALASRSGGPTDWKAYFIAAKAAYELRDFRISKQYFDSALELKPGAANIQKDYERCLSRLQERKGDYDLAAMTLAVSPKNIHIDRASFLSRTEVRDSLHHGRGLFATEDIRAGEMVFAERAASVPNEFNPNHNAAAAYAQLIELCADNPTVHKRVLDLYGGTYRRSGHEGTIVDGKPVVDVFLLESIRRKNCFSGDLVTAQAAKPGWDIWKQGMSRGLWVHAAYANHACLPNTNRSFIGDMLIATATVDIPAGTEITHIYLPPKAAYLLRMSQFRHSWGFVCSCALCEGEGKSPAEQHKKRNAALAEFEAVIKQRPPARFHPDATIRQVERLANRLSALHEAEVYDGPGLPRLMLVWPTMWLVEAWYARKQWGKVVRWVNELLRNFGFAEPVREGRLWVYKDTRAVTTFEVVKALKLSAEAYAALGKEVLARDCLAAARVGLKTMVGHVTDETFKAFR